VPDKTFFGATLTDQVHPAKRGDPKTCVFTGAGNWSNKIYHFNPETPHEAISSGGDEVCTEYFVPYKDFPEVLKILIELSP